MGSPYQSQSASNYNNSPPPDDGSTVAANKITWAGIKTKLADSIKTLADAINTALRSALNVTPSTTSIAYTTLVGDHMTTIEVTGTTTISLGDAATMVAQSMGYTVTIYNKDTALNTTVALITNTNKLDGTANGTTTIEPGQSKTFTVAQSGVDYETISASYAQLTGTTASTFTFDGSGGTSASKTLTWQKIGKWVRLNIPAVTGTSGTSSTLLGSDTALPASVRPTSTQDTIAGVIQNNGSAVAAAGLIRVNTSGVVQIFRDGTASAFTNSTVCGTATNTGFTYFTG